MLTQLMFINLALAFVLELDALLAVIEKLWRNCLSPTLATVQRRYSLPLCTEWLRGR